MQGRGRWGEDISPIWPWLIQPAGMVFIRSQFVSHNRNPFYHMGDFLAVPFRSHTCFLAPTALLKRPCAPTSLGQQVHLATGLNNLHRRRQEHESTWRPENRLSDRENWRFPEIAITSLLPDNPHKHEPHHPCNCERHPWQPNRGNALPLHACLPHRRKAPDRNFRKNLPTHERGFLA